MHAQLIASFVCPSGLNRGWRKWRLSFRFFLNRGCLIKSTKVLLRNYETIIWTIEQIIINFYQFLFMAFQYQHVSNKTTRPDPKHWALGPIVR